MNLDDGAVAVLPMVEPCQAAWGELFSELFARVAGEFLQAASRKRARGYLLGLLSQSERKNGWSIAEFAGEGSPDGMQRLLNFYSWDADEVRDRGREYVVAGIGDLAGVLVVDETGFLKKGRMSAGVQRQYSGTAGRVENCQVGVFLAYANRAGDRALLDRGLYLPLTRLRGLAADGPVMTQLDGRPVMIELDGQAVVEHPLATDGDDEAGS